MPSIPTPDLYVYAGIALFMGIGVLLLGWMLGLNDRDQRTACETSRLRTELVQTSHLLAESRAICKHLQGELYSANERIRHLQSSNQALVMRAVLPEEFRGG